MSVRLQKFHHQPKDYTYRLYIYSLLLYTAVAVAINTRKLQACTKLRRLSKGMAQKSVAASFIIFAIFISQTNAGIIAINFAF